VERAAIAWNILLAAGIPGVLESFTSLPSRRRLRCQHPLRRFNVDKRISIEMCRDDIRPLIEDLMKCIVILNVENRNRAPPHAGIDLPTYTSCLVPGNPRPERLPRLC
jgi:hypothetical protein